MIYDVSEYFFYLGLDHAINGGDLFIESKEETLNAEMYNYGLAYGQQLTLEEYYENF